MWVRKSFGLYKFKRYFFMPILFTCGQVEWTTHFGNCRYCFQHHSLFVDYVSWLVAIQKRRGVVWWSKALLHLDSSCICESSSIHLNNYHIFKKMYMLSSFLIQYHDFRILWWRLVCWLLVQVCITGVTMKITQQL